jgi:hypothetical protein
MRISSYGSEKSSIVLGSPEAVSKVGCSCRIVLLTISRWFLPRRFYPVKKEIIIARPECMGVSLTGMNTINALVLIFGAMALMQHQVVISISIQMKTVISMIVLSLLTIGLHSFVGRRFAESPIV